METTSEAITTQATTWGASIWLGGILLVVLAIVAWYLIVLYNKLIKLRTQVENAFSDVDVHLKSRFNLVENLVQTVKGYATHEQELLENVTKARSIYNNATGPDEKIEADNMLTWTLKTLFSVAESYPDLKANASFLSLQQKLSDLEENIAWARRYYNAAVKDFNITLQSFPANLIWGILWFTIKKFFEIAEAEKAVPKVDFGA